jgi:probable selenium-dependent hydroxylase accessory protein YqeC
MIELTPITRLASALSLGRHELVTLVGGGGKTTALFALGGQLGPTAILTTTTKMGRDRTGGYMPLFDPAPEQLEAALAATGSVLAWQADDDHRALGVSPETCDRWFDMADHVIVEADGSRRRPFKAPLDYEPVVPSRTTVLVACVGAGAFNGVIAEVCQRPERVADLAGCAPADALTPSRLAKVLLSAHGSRKGCPPDARFVVMLNKVGRADESYIAEVGVRVEGAAELVAVATFAPEDAPELG